MFNLATLTHAGSKVKGVPKLNFSQGLIVKNFLRLKPIKLRHAEVTCELDHL